MKNLLCVLTPCGAATVGGTSKALGSGYSADSPVPRYFDLLTAGGVARSIRAQAKIFIAGGEAAHFMTAIQQADVQISLSTFFRRSFRLDERRLDTLLHLAARCRRKSRGQMTLRYFSARRDRAAKAAGVT